MWGKLESHIQKNEIGHLYPSQKWTQNGFNDLTIRPETVKLLEGNRGKNPHDVNIGNNFLDIITKTQIKKKQK